MRFIRTITISALAIIFSATCALGVTLSVNDAVVDKQQITAYRSTLQSVILLKLQGELLRLFIILMSCSLSLLKAVFLTLS